jgi:hypothetical protein
MGQEKNNIKLFNKTITSSIHKKHVYKPSYIGRGWNGRKAKLFINRFKHIQNYAPKSINKL